MIVLVTLEAVVIVLLTVLVAGLLRSHADILQRLHDLGAGDHTLKTQLPEPTTGRSGTAEPPGPLLVGTQVARAGRDGRQGVDVVGRDATGATRRIGVVGTDHPTLLAFLSTGCSTCASFWQTFRSDDDLGLPGGCRVAVVTRGPEVESESEVRALASDHVPTVMSSDAFIDMEVPGAPYFVLVDGPSGAIIGEGSGSTWEQVGTLMRQSLADAGLALSSTGRAVPHLDGPAREARADAELLSAGIRPGDPALYPSRPSDVGPTADPGESASSPETHARR